MNTIWIKVVTLYMLHMNKWTKLNEPDGIQEAGAEEVEVEIEVEIEIGREKEIQISDGIVTGEKILFSFFSLTYLDEECASTIFLEKYIFVNALIDDYNW